MISNNKLSHDNFDAWASSIVAETNALEVGENVAIIPLLKLYLMDG